MALLAKQSASPVSSKWGLWAQPIDELKHDAMRPASWIAQNNPTFPLRSLLKGDVRSKVITALAEQGLHDVSETDLTRRAGCTRRAMHLALENLEAAGLIVRQRQGRSYAISLCRLRKPCPREKRLPRTVGTPTGFTPRTHSGDYLTHCDSSR
jgi:biotin operon repressor